MNCKQMEAEKQIKKHLATTRNEYETRIQKDRQTETDSETYRVAYYVDPPSRRR